MSFYQLLYVSGTARPMSEQDIAQILTTSRRNNGALGVTGMLLHADGAFIQVLEGEEQTVLHLADRIKRDQRHRNFMVLYEMNAARRAFADWQMGFRRLDPSLEADNAVFSTTLAALDERIGKDDSGLLFAAVTAFGKDFVS